MRLAAPELAPQSAAVGADSLRILALAVVPIALAGVLGAVLQAHDRFAAAAASTLIVSTSMVVFTLGLGDALGVQAASLGVLVGSVLQLAVLLPDLITVRPLARPGRTDVGEVEQAARRVGPVSGLMGLVAARPALERSFAASLGTGLVTIVGLGSRTGSFFANLVGTALATAVFPQLSRAVARGDEEGLARSIRFAVSFTLLTTLPVAVAALLLSGDLATLLFQHGSVTDPDAAKIAMSMSAYAPAILLAPLVDVLSRVRYAHGDTTWPLAATALGLLANALVLVIAPILGLAAFGMGFTLNVLVMLVVLGSRERPLLRAFMPQASALGVSFGASGAAFVTYLLGRELGGHEGPVAVLAGLVLAGVVYLAVVVALVGPGILPRSIVHFGRGLLARRRLARASAGSRRPDG